ncbi:MAG: tRNA uridine-5-carboxymethylaminomethyl(34) synthesis GTPase MnmE [Rhodospirillaceae bacterium]|nr:tRNA uridine-5-carboxymethylaminomethyl(34) synthesis GTPase MnmE [Rhodospirillaceae bacterium]
MSQNFEDTIFALATGSLYAATALIRISGNGASRTANILGFKLQKQRLASVAILKDGERKLDEALVIFFKGPRSYTGEDVMELHVHGGRAVIEAVINTLRKQKGFRTAEPGEFTKRAVLNGKIDLTKAEGINDLIQAETEAQRVQSFAQVDGALSDIAFGWREKAIRIAAHVEAYIDFPDEEIPESTLTSLGDEMSVLVRDIEKGLNDGRRGEILREGFRIAVIGPPNAGKSTLVNWLSRRPVSIISEQPGTTRDVLEASLDLGGYPVIIADTAGLRASTDPIENEGIKRAQEWAKKANGRVILLEPSTGAGFLERLKPNPESDLVVVNKIDLLPMASKKEETLAISLKDEIGLDKLLSGLKKIVSKSMASQEPAVITRIRHREALQSCLNSIKSAKTALFLGEEPEIVAEELRAATKSLGRVVGAVDVEDLLDVVFGDFCIGK